jgi:hypothetical protein
MVAPSGGRRNVRASPGRNGGAAALLRDRWTRRRGVKGARGRAGAGGRRDDLISISYVERSNLNARMDCGRFTRLTNRYSKKLRRWFDELARACRGPSGASVERYGRAIPVPAADLPG